MITDPPYGVDYDPGWRNEAAEKGLIGYGARREGKVENDDRASWLDAWKLFPGSVVYCWHAGVHATQVATDLEAAGFEIRSQIIWAKNNFAISRGHYHWKHEPCWYAVRKGSTASWIGDRSQTTLWEIDQSTDGQKTDHGTQKPLECMARPIRNHEGDVYDPFLGSGTTLIAAHRAGRRCFGMEIDPRYLDVILKRYEAETGEEPVLERRE
jgi:DNA modification methylase